LICQALTDGFIYDHAPLATAPFVPEGLRVCSAVKIIVVMSSQVTLAEVLAAPALKPPPGVTANFDNPPNENTLAWVVTTFCMVVATLCLCLRSYVRLWLDKRIRIEEGEPMRISPWTIDSSRLTSPLLCSNDVLCICMLSRSLSTPQPDCLLSGPRSRSNL
jgi:hypothetical protein